MLTWNLSQDVSLSFTWDMSHDVYLSLLGMCPRMCLCPYLEHVSGCVLSWDVSQDMSLSSPKGVLECVSGLVFPYLGLFFGLSSWYMGIVCLLIKLASFNISWFLSI